MPARELRRTRAGAIADIDAHLGWRATVYTLRVSASPDAPPDRLHHARRDLDSRYLGAQEDRRAGGDLLHSHIAPRRQWTGQRDGWRAGNVDGSQFLSARSQACEPGLLQRVLD